MERLAILTLSLGALACASSGPPIRSPQPVRSAPTSCISATSADTTVYGVAQIDEKPIFRTALPLTYPPVALHNHIEGRVVVGAIVNRGGDVDQSSITIVRHVDPWLDAEARRIVSSATLWPACRNGVPVRMRIAVPFDFEVRGPVLKVWHALAIGVPAGIIAALIRGNH